MFEKMEKWLDKLTHKKTKFKGYDSLETEAIVLGLFNEDGEVVTELNNEKGFVIFDTTPFYALGGGQESDNGIIKKDDGKTLEMIDVRKDVVDGYYIHYVDTKDSSLVEGEKTKLLVNVDKRTMSGINHSALHTTWQTILNHVGHYVDEVGSKLNDEKYQLQFAVDPKLNEELVLEVTNYLNKEVYTKDIQSNIFYVDQKTAEEKGYLYEFTKLKEDEEVRIVEFPGIVLEPCSGTHVNSTIEIQRTFFMNYDKNKDRILIDMTANYSFAKSYFEDKIDSKVDQINDILNKIKELDNAYVMKFDIDHLKNNDEHWNYITIKFLIDVYNEITKDYNKLAKEKQKELAMKLDEIDIPSYELSINGYDAIAYQLNDKDMIDKLIVPKTMKFAKEHQDKQIIVMTNVTDNGEVIVITSNAKDIALNNLLELNNVNETLNLKGGGNPKLLVLSSSEKIDVERVLKTLL